MPPFAYPKMRIMTATTYLIELWLSMKIFEYVYKVLKTVLEDTERYIYLLLLCYHIRDHTKTNLSFYCHNFLDFSMSLHHYISVKQRTIKSTNNLHNNCWWLISHMLLILLLALSYLMEIFTLCQELYLLSGIHVSTISHR